LTAGKLQTAYTNLIFRNCYAVTDDDDDDDDERITKNGNVNLQKNFSSVSYLILLQYFHFMERYMNINLIYSDMKKF